MRAVLALLLVSACGGPSHAQLVESPSATTRARPANAPPASTSDADRDALRRSFEDMEITQQSYREANHAEHTKPPPAPVKRSGPAEQATLPEDDRPKKRGPAEQATLPDKPTGKQKSGPAKRAK